MRVIAGFCVGIVGGVAPALAGAEIAPDLMAKVRLSSPNDGAKLSRLALITERASVLS